MTQIAPLGRYRAFDANGDPLAGGKLYTYEAGTSTPKATFTTAAGTIANANPVILDADGYADVWLGTGGYKFSLFNASDVLQWTVDNIDGGAAAGFASQAVSRSSSFSLGVNDQNVVNVCTSPLTVSLLPAGTAGDGFTSIILNLSGGNVTIDPDGSETINNTGTLTVGNGQSAIISTDGLEWYAFGYTQVEFSDSVFRIVDNADITKKLAFEVSGVTTGTTTTLSVTNNSLSLPATGSLESQLVLQERLTSGGNTATIVPANPLAANRTYTLPDATGNVVLDTTLASETTAGAVELATAAEQATGTDAQRVVPVSGMPLTLISTQTASSSADLRFTGLSSTYRGYRFTFVNVVPATDNAEFTMQYSTDNGSTWVTTNYIHSSVYLIATSSSLIGQGSASDTRILMSAPTGGSNFAVSNVANEGGIVGNAQIYGHSSSLNKKITFQVTYVAAVGNLSGICQGGGHNTGTTAVNAVRFLFHTGNIASGTISAYGIR